MPRTVRCDSNQECALPVMPMLESMDQRIPWLTVSNAANKSSRISTEDLAVALASFKASVTANRAVLVEWPLLNSEWFGSRTLLFLFHFYI